MLALCLLIGALCVVAIRKANKVTEEPLHVEIEETPDIWSGLPPKWHPPVSKTGER